MSDRTFNIMTAFPCICKHVPQAENVELYLTCKLEYNSIVWPFYRNLLCICIQPKLVSLWFLVNLVLTPENCLLWIFCLLAEVLSMFSSINWISSKYCRSWNTFCLQLEISTSPNRDVRRKVVSSYKSYSGRCFQISFMQSSLI